MDKKQFEDISYKILFVLIILIIPTWFRYGESTLDWLITFESWGFRMLAFPVLVLFFLRKEKSFWLYLSLILLTFISNVSDLGFIDQYDTFFLTIKIVITLNIFYLLYKRHKGKKDEIFL